MFRRLFSWITYKRSPWAKYLKKSERFGFSGPVIFLSFDCDTDLDIPLVTELAHQLKALNIKATFAVPGCQLIKGKNKYSTLAEEGFEFINHGMLPHAEWDGKKYVGITFYDKMSRNEVMRDILEADKLIFDILGKKPLGFRAPHFGSFQKGDEVQFLHKICSELGYTYASTTIPQYAFEHGPAVISGNIVELPVMGSWRDPFTILDSWNYLADRVTYRLSDMYYELFEETLTTALSRKLPLLLSWYADPCHVFMQTPFIRAMELIARNEIKSCSGSECAAMMRQSLDKPCVE